MTMPSPMPLDRALRELRLRAEQAWRDGSESVNYLSVVSGVNASTLVLIAQGDMTVLSLNVVVKLAAHWGVEINCRELRRLAC